MDVIRRSDQGAAFGGAPARLGEYYRATVPDTLDLAERGRLGLHHATSIISEAHDYEMYWRGCLNRRDRAGYKFYMYFQNSPLMACEPKYMEAMAMARLMSGSQQGLELEARMVDMLASHIGEEGIYWVPPYPDRPWLGPQEARPFANVHGQARMMRAMLAWYQYTGDPIWAERIDRMVDGMDRHLVVHVDDYAYYPVGGWLDAEYFSSCYLKGRGWRHTDEPADEKSGEEGSLFNHQGHHAGVLANWYRMSGNEQALRLAGELVRFITKPKFWADWPAGEYPGVNGPEHAHWRGHWYGHINTLTAVLEYAIAVNDTQLKGFARDGYEWARQKELGAIGYFDLQGCATPRLIGLAIKLSDAGMGDYWEDVDRYIRNQGVEMQFTPADIAYLRAAEAGRPDPPEDPRQTGATTAGAIEAAVGGFAVDYFKLHWAGCCSPWGVMGMYYAWEGALRYADGVARVNLLLNRASPWIDMDSFLPYEGKVVLRNKAARELFLRLPLWAPKGRVRCRVGEAEASPLWFGSYLRLSGLAAGDVVTVEFPVQERTERWTASPEFRASFVGWDDEPTRGFRFKGNTLVEITPPLPSWQPGESWWLYQGRAETYRAERAPMTEVLRFVTPLVLTW